MDSLVPLQPVVDLGVLVRVVVVDDQVQFPVGKGSGQQTQEGEKVVDPQLVISSIGRRARPGARLILSRVSVSRARWAGSAIG
jgi:hypothetical protein